MTYQISALFSTHFFNHYFVRFICLAKATFKPLMTKSFLTTCFFLGSVLLAPSHVLALDELVTKYEEGMRLLKSCQKSLEAAELRIEQLGKRGEESEG